MYFTTVDMHGLTLHKTLPHITANPTQCMWEIRMWRLAVSADEWKWQSHTNSEWRCAHFMQNNLAAKVVADTVHVT